MSSTLDYYNRNAAAASARYVEADMRELHEWLLTAVPPRSRVLELGCGCGRETAFLHSRGFDVTATDGSREMLDQAAHLFPELEGRLQHLVLPTRFPFPDFSFDNILALAVLMHLDPEAIKLTFSEIRRVLKPGGKLLLSVPTSRTGINGDGYDDKGRLFTQMPKRSWHELAETCDLALVSQTQSEDALGRKGIRWLNAVYIERTSGTVEQTRKHTSSRDGVPDSKR
jgi:SAM-dependent methyltransferase